MLEAKNLSKRYGKNIVVNNVNLKIDSDKFIAILGPNGAGKSTLINMMIGLLEPSSGQITYGNLKVNSSEYKQKIGVVFQDSILDENLSVKKNLTYRLQMYKDIDNAWFEDLLDEFMLRELLNQNYGNLSGGQKRRVDIARSLLNKPEILFLDEPSTGLDIQNRKLIWDILMKLKLKYKFSIVLTTHYLEESEAADFIYIIDKGNIIASDSVGNLKNEYVKSILTLKTKNHESLNRIYEKYKAFSQKKDEDTLVIKLDGARQAYKILEDADWIDFEFQKGTIDDIFLTLTGKELRA
ncbi:hypothetical protein BG261_01605 [Floricoccus tropicus]|uniref:ABC transporter domain-containing protein n=1 Tax=Floricoccus tropicus TaxID=1859473 RepID=A0A1E8GNV3_9LACT|nr:ABC transporter ATP-binding protein [Floricoccus tropicus]OFI49303.1 hypothetical protein BG261_01605 [Floricoccus tropicus]